MIKSILHYFLIVLMVVSYNTAHAQDNELFTNLVNVTQTQMEDIANPNQGQLLFNTTQKEVYYYKNATDGWVPVKPIIRAAKWVYEPESNPIDLNVTTSANVNVMKDNVFNDDPALYTVSNNGASITVSEAGKYHIMVNLAVVRVSSNSNRVSVALKVKLNGNESTSFRPATAYIRGDGGDGAGHMASSLHLNEVLSLEANQVLTFETTALIDGNTGTGNEVTLQQDKGTSALAIYKIE